MNTALYSLIPLALLAVAVILSLGLWNMLRAGSGDKAQKLMRWRVVLQFVAVILVMGALYFIRG
jgi:Na+/H+ antiporter NhaC